MVGGIDELIYGKTCRKTWFLSPKNTGFHLDFPKNTDSHLEFPKNTGFHLEFPKNTDFHLEFPIKSGRRTSLGIGVISLRRRNLALGIDPGTENEVLIHFFEYQILGKWMFFASGFRATQFSGHRENIPILQQLTKDLVISQLSFHPPIWQCQEIPVSMATSALGGRVQPMSASFARSKYIKIYHSQLKIYHLVVSINGCTVRCTPKSLVYNGKSYSNGRFSRVPHHFRTSIELCWIMVKP